MVSGKLSQGRLRRLLSEKLGRCPRCMRSSIIGSLAGWPVAIAAIAADLEWPLGVVPIAALLIAGSFTVLILAHLAVFTRRIARAMRDSPDGPALSRREFAVTCVGLSATALYAALFGTSCSPDASPTAATGSLPASAAGGVAANSETTDLCAACLNRCVERFTVCTGRADSTHERELCLQTFRRCQELCRIGEGPCAEVPPPQQPRCSPLSGTICDQDRDRITQARCQGRCDPGTPRCRQVAPNDFCEGKLRGPVFVRRVGNQRLFCRWCACICGVFVPPVRQERGVGASMLR